MCWCAQSCFLVPPSLTGGSRIVNPCLMTLPLLAAGSGGGVAVVGSDSVQTPVVCEQGLYWTYMYFLEVSVVDSVISGNSASGPRSALPSGGGLYFDAGGLLTLSRSLLVNNSAVHVGGGLRMGGGGAVEACGGILDGVNLEGNTAGRGGAQVHMACSADLKLTNSSVLLGNTTSEVRCHFWNFGCQWAAPP